MSPGSVAFHWEHMLRLFLHQDVASRPCSLQTWPQQPSYLARRTLPPRPPTPASVSGLSKAAAPLMCVSCSSKGSSGEPVNNGWSHAALTRRLARDRTEGVQETGRPWKEASAEQAGCKGGWQASSSHGHKAQRMAVVSQVLCLGCVRQTHSQMAVSSCSVCDGAEVTCHRGRPHTCSNAPTWYEVHGGCLRCAVTAFLQVRRQNLEVLLQERRNLRTKETRVGVAAPKFR